MITRTLPTGGKEIDAHELNRTYRRAAALIREAASDIERHGDNIARGRLPEAIKAAECYLQHLGDALELIALESVPLDIAEPA